jgi:hypothetical protein
MISQAANPHRPSQTQAEALRTRLKAKIAAALLTFARLLLLCATATAQQAQTSTSEAPVVKDYKSFVTWMRATHRAPFLADPMRMMSPQERATFEKDLAARVAANADKTPKKPFVNVQVNQDRNPYPKYYVTQAVDPSEPANVIVVASDTRQNLERSFYHVSTDHGRKFTDDAISAGTDDVTLGSPALYNDFAVPSFDAEGNEYLIQITSQGITDFQFAYSNLDQGLQLIQGSSHGLYLGQLGIDLDVQPCDGPGLRLPENCSGFLQSPSAATDINASSPTTGTTYVSVTLFCEFMGDSDCPAIGNVDLAPGQSGIFGVSFKNINQNGWQGTGLISGSHLNAAFSSTVVDSGGTPHVFFDDFTDPSAITMWESTLTNGAWVVSAQPVASFSFGGNVGDGNTASSAAPQCSIFQMTAYCAFSASQITGGQSESSESVYVAEVQVATGASKIVRVNNDAFGNGKTHLFPSAVTVPSGAVYVGWYDGRNDPNGVNVEYFAAKATDGGATFPTQMAVSDVPFDPCGASSPCFFGPSNTQLAAGPGGQVHAAWSDFRDGVSLAIWSQTITW